MHIASIGINLGKTTFHLVALGERNKVLARKKFSRAPLLRYTANLPAALIGLEACAGAHFLGSALRAQGHQVRLIPGQFVNPYRKSNKNDFIDAEAIAEAVTQQNMRFVQIKTQEQLDWQAMHRVRDRLMQRRTALINEIRGFLLERGLTFAARPIYLRKNLPTVIEDAEQSLTPRLRWRLDRLWQEWKQMEIDIKAITDEIERISNDDAPCRRLRQIPGSMLYQLSYPLTILRVRFAPGNCLDMLRVGQNDLKVIFKYVPYRFPINTCGLHRHVLDSQLVQPSYQFTKFTCGRSEASNVLQWSARLCDKNTSGDRRLMYIQSAAPHI